MAEHGCRMVFFFFPSACFCTSEKLLHVWNYNCCFLIHCDHLVLFLKTKKLGLLPYYVFTCSHCLWTFLWLYHLVLIHCDHMTTKPFLLGLRRRGRERANLVFILCSGLHSWNLVKTWDLWQLLLCWMQLKSSIYLELSVIWG